MREEGIVPAGVKEKFRPGYSEKTRLAKNSPVDLKRWGAREIVNQRRMEEKKNFEGGEAKKNLRHNFFWRPYCKKDSVKNIQQGRGDRGTLISDRRKKLS